MHARGREKRWHGRASCSWPSEVDVVAERVARGQVVVEKGVWLRPRAPSGRAESTRTQGPWRPHVGSHQCVDDVVENRSPMWKHGTPKEVEKYDLLVEKNRVATRRKAGRRWRERKSQVDCSGACANLDWKNVRA